MPFQGEMCQYDTDTDTSDNYNARTLLEASLDTDHYGGCWEESEPCQGKVCRYDPEGEYDTDTDNGDNYNARTVLGASLDTDECQFGQFICLGQTPSFVNWHGYCELCKGHFRGCWDKNQVAECKGETCKYYTLLEASLDTDFKAGRVVPADRSVFL